MPALLPLALVALTAIAPVVAFVIIALVSLKDTKPADRPKILNELSAMIAWRSGQQGNSRGRLQRRRPSN